MKKTIDTIIMRCKTAAYDSIGNLVFTISEKTNDNKLMRKAGSYYDKSDKAYVDYCNKYEIPVEMFSFYKG